MTRPNLARLEPSAYTVLSVADPAKVATTTGQVLGELDLDHLCRLLIRSERSLSLVNRRSFAAALADVPALPNQALRPAPPFPEAVASAREDGKLLERTRLYLAQNPRALEELTPELTLALLRHFDPSMRMRPSPFTRHVVAVGSVTAIALVAAVLGIVHTQQNDVMTASDGAQQAARIERMAAESRTPSLSNTHYDTQIAVIPRTRPVAPPQPFAVKAAPASLTPSTTRASVPAATVPHYVPHATVPASTTAVATNTSLFVATPAAKVSAAAPAAASAQIASAGARPGDASHATAGTPSTTGATTVTPTTAASAASAEPAATGAAQDNGAAATALVLRTIVAQNPNASVEWIRAAKSSDHVVTVTSRVHSNSSVSQETYQLYNSDGRLTVMNHRSATP